MLEFADLISRGKRQGHLRARRKSNYPGLISHITQRATGKELLFVEDIDYLYLLKLLKDIAGEFDLTVFSFCLMTNHVHLLLRQNRDNLFAAMQSLFGRYAIYFNHKYQRKGHLFCGPFRQSACYGKYYFLAASIYIHLNPVRAGMVSQAGEYRWSTWNLYCETREPESFVDWKYALRFLDADVPMARSKYRELIDQARIYKPAEVLKNRNVIGRFSGWLRGRFPGIVDEEKPELLPEGCLDDSDLNRLISHLKGKKRLSKPTDIQARKFAAEQLQARGFSTQEIMDCLNISRATIYTILSR